MVDKSPIDGQGLAPRSGAFVLVVSDAVIGGGFDLRCGQRVAVADLGDYALQLVEVGAVVPTFETANGYADVL